MVANHVLLGGVPEGFDAMAIEKEAGKGGVIYIARDANRMQALRSAFVFLRLRCLFILFLLGIAFHMTALRPVLISALNGCQV